MGHCKNNGSVSVSNDCLGLPAIVVPRECTASPIQLKSSRAITISGCGWAPNHRSGIVCLPCTVRGQWPLIHDSVSKQLNTQA